MSRVTATQEFMLLEVDFSTDFGINFELSDETKSVLADAVVDQIKERSQSGRALHGNKFKQYTEKYAQKKGVGTGDVDLTLSEDMFNAMQVDDIVGDTLTINFEDDNVIPRAFNHHTGDTLPKRAFFGIQKKELSSIKRENRDLINRDRRDQAAINAAVESGGVDFG